MKVMYEVVTLGTAGFNADVLKFTDELSEAKKIPGDIWKITYEGDGWKRWKEEKIFEANKQLSLL